MTLTLTCTTITSEGLTRTTPTARCKRLTAGLHLLEEHTDLAAAHLTGHARGETLTRETLTEEGLLAGTRLTLTGPETHLTLEFRLARA